MDEEFENGMSLDEAVAAANPVTDDENPSETVESIEETDEDTVDEDGDESDDGAGDTDEDSGDDSEGEPEEADADPEAVVKYTVNGEEKKLKVKDLARLAGQEAALTQRGQALAEQRKAVEQQGLAAMEVMKRQYEKAQEKLARFKDFDPVIFAKDASEEDYRAVVKAKADAEAEVKFLENEATEFLTTVRENREKLVREAGKEALKAITDPTNRFYIPDWNEQLYNNIRTFAVSEGLNQDEVNQIVDPAVMRLLNIAMNAVKSEKTKAETKAKVKEKIAKAPTKALSKGKTTPSNGSANIQKLRAQAARTGSLDDVLRLHEAELAAKDD
jgi:hypothetical protein